MDEKEVMLEVRNLRKNYGKEEVLKGISFEIGEGEIFSLVGPNGAGKTTTIKAILNLTMDYEGEIRIHAEKINYLAENEVPYSGMDVYEYLKFYADLMNVEYSRILDMLKLVELKSHLTKKCRNLSKGMKQRLLIARTFLNDPEFLILDEPFSGVDPAMREKLLKFMREYVSKTNGAIFLTTHILSDVERLSHKVAIMRDGKIINMGEVGELGESANGRKEIRLRIIQRDMVTRAIDKLKGIPGVSGVYSETEDVIRCEYSGEISEYDILSILFKDEIKFRIISGDLESVFKEVKR